MGHYQVSLYFGEDMGVDDSDVPLSDRMIRIMAAPVGFLGEVRRLWVGTLSELGSMSLAQQPDRLPNPPERLPSHAGVYAWGADRSIDEFMNGRRFENKEDS